MLREKDNDDDYEDSDFLSYFARKKAPKKKLTPFTSYLKVVAGVFLCLMFKLFFKKPPPVPMQQPQRVYYYSTPTNSNLNFHDK
ncbi:conserved rodent malaria protein, unknown function [Plasmodium vinckei brucechwatti]|uniref:Uncharacterized protein n=1 Tax=Plasmodium vinckei brucechwatti TaxID=119398 RepID=A0A6V7S164_PLAVN|nr:conserved rodent malaria protein, unknown function [Plasmodium vinckei brucechwatti]